MEVRKARGVDKLLLAKVEKVEKVEKEKRGRTKVRVAVAVAIGALAGVTPLLPRTGPGPVLACYWGVAVGQWACPRRV